MLQFPRIMIFGIALEKYEHFYPGQSQTMIIAARCFNFQRSYYLGSPWKVRILLSRTINNYDYSWEVLQFPRVMLCRITLEKYEYFHPGQSKTMIIAERCFNFQGSCYLGSPWKVRILPFRTIKKYDYSWEVLHFPRIMLCGIALKKYEHFYPRQ